MRILTLTLFLMVSLGFMAAGCTNHCEPCYKDMHVWKYPPKDDDAAKAQLGKFASPDCRGVMPHWAWKGEQEGNLECRDYKLPPQYARQIGQKMSYMVTKVFDDVAGVSVAFDQMNYARMMINTIQECGIKISATQLKNSSPVCEKGGDRNDTFEPHLYVKRTYKVNWSNSYKMSKKDLFKLKNAWAEISEKLPGMEVEFKDDKEYGLLMVKWPEVWAAWKHGSLVKGRCQHQVKWDE